MVRCLAFFSERFKRNFAFVTCGLLHFVLETAYTIFVGQSFLGYLPDCIADVLLLAGTYALKTPEARHYMRRLGLYLLFAKRFGRGA